MPCYKEYSNNLYVLTIILYTQKIISSPSPEKYSKNKTFFFFNQGKEQEIPINHKNSSLPLQILATVTFLSSLRILPNQSLKLGGQLHPPHCTLDPGKSEITLLNIKFQESQLIPSTFYVPTFSWTNIYWSKQKQTTTTKQDIVAGYRNSKNQITSSEAPWISLFCLHQAHRGSTRNREQTLALSPVLRRTSGLVGCALFTGSLVLIKLGQYRPEVPHLAGGGGRGVARGFSRLVHLQEQS